MNDLQLIIKETLKKNKRNLFTFLTGAGVSADSGIPTYRGTDGIWIKGTKYHKPEEFGTLKYFKNHPEEVWQYTLFRKKMFEEALPNENHKLIAEIESILQDHFHLITQNIDNLHRRAGNKRIYEIHGNLREIKCGDGCKEILPFPKGLSSKNLTEDLTSKDINLLQCPDCGKWVRPNILWFDEIYDEKNNKKFSALKIAKNSGILFIIGTSGATNLPIELAKTTLKYGGYVIDVNLENNEFTKILENKKRKLIIRKNAVEVLKEIKKIISDEIR